MSSPDVPRLSPHPAPTPWRGPPAATGQMAGAVGKTAVFAVHYRRSETPVQATPYPIKVAKHPDSRQPLAVSPDTPERAICPHCDGWL
ncbi:MAG: hypothetical protein IPM39_08995 [Chloroflexi bacterium]|nr:hypothetical protein [Chloroflexota bacterium]